MTGRSTLFPSPLCFAKLVRDFTPLARRSTLSLSLSLVTALVLGGVLNWQGDNFAQATQTATLVNVNGSSSSSATLPAGTYSITAQTWGGGGTGGSGYYVSFNRSGVNNLKCGGGGGGGSGGYSAATWSRSVGASRSISYSAGGAAASSSASWNSNTTSAGGGGNGGSAAVDKINTVNVTVAVGTGGAAGTGGSAGSDGSFVMHSTMQGQSVTCDVAGGAGGVAASGYGAGGIGGAMNISVTPTISNNYVNILQGVGSSGSAGSVGRVTISYTRYVPTYSSKSISTGSVGGGDTMTINGSELNFITGVRFCGSTFGGNFSVVSGSQVRVTVPAGSGGSCAVELYHDSAEYIAAGTYTYVGVPTVTGVSPSSGTLLGGQSVTVSGSNFINGGTTIKFDNTAASCSFVSTSQMTCTTPAHAVGAVSVSVTTTGGTGSLASAYTYIYPAPTISAVSPNTGLTTGNTSVEITGTNFYSTVTVKFDGLAASCTVNSVTKLTCSTPVHPAAGVADIEVTAGGGVVTSASAYTYYEPTISLSFDKIGVNMSGTPSAMMYDSLLMKVITDNPTGYNLTIESTQPDLKCTTSNDYIFALPSPGSLAANTWGYGVGTSTGGQTKPSNWTGLTTIPAIFKNLTTATDLTLGDDTRLWFGADTDYLLPVCTFEGGVTITALFAP